MQKALARSAFRVMASAKIGLIAGKGDLPALVIQAAQEQGREIFVLAIKDNTDPLILSPTEQGEAARAEGESKARGNIPPHYKWIEMADIVTTLDIFRAEGVTEIVMAGGIKRPPLKAFKPSPFTTKLITRIGRSFFGGDDTLLKTIVQIFEEEGFKIIAANDLLTDLVAPSGVLTTTAPDATAEADIACGFQQMKEFGKLDLGQALIVFNGEVLGKEDASGTDALITLCSQIAHPTEQGEARSAGERREPQEAKPSTYKGLLIKARKMGQEERVDMPSIGVETIRNLHAHGFAGVAVEAGGALIIRKAETLALANELGLFVVGYQP